MRWSAKATTTRSGARAPTSSRPAPGSDYIFGNGGNDTIVAGTGTDYIYSNAGDDFIYTDDLVTNSQDFVYVSGLSGFGTGIDTVADFTPGPGGDVAVIVGTPGLTTFAQAQAKMTQPASIRPSTCRPATSCTSTTSIPASSPPTTSSSCRASAAIGSELSLPTSRRMPQRTRRREETADDYRVIDHW